MLVNEVFTDMVNQFVFVYLDDILIFYKELTTHERHVRPVLLRLLQNNVFVKAEKCDFQHFFYGFHHFTQPGDHGLVQAQGANVKSA